MTCGIDYVTDCRGKNIGDGMNRVNDFIVSTNEEFILISVCIKTKERKIV